MQPRGILESALYADDLDAAEAFYTAVLGLEVIAKQPGRHVFFKCGPGVLLVFDPRSTREDAGSIGGAPIPAHGSEGPGHLAFAASAEEIEPWKTRLAAHGVEIESEVRWPGGGLSIYFRDPSGNSLEIAESRIWPLDRTC